MTRPVLSAAIGTAMGIAAAFHHLRRPLANSGIPMVALNTVPRTQEASDGD